MIIITSDSLIRETSQDNEADAEEYFDQTLWHDDEDDFYHDFDDGDFDDDDDGYDNFDHDLEFDYDRDHDFDYDHDDYDYDDFCHDDNDDASYLKSMHHPPERMKGQAIKGIPPSSGKATNPNDQESKSFRNQSEKGTTAQWSKKKMSLESIWRI